MPKMSKQAAAFKLDPSVLADAVRGAFLPGVRPEHRVVLARLVAEDVVAHPPKKAPNGAAIVDRNGLWSRLGGAVVEERQGQPPLTVQHAIPHRGGGPAFALEDLAHVLLATSDERTGLVARLRALDSLAAFFLTAHQELAAEPEELRRRAAELAAEVDSLRARADAAEKRAAKMADAKEAMSA